MTFAHYDICLKGGKANANVSFTFRRLYHCRWVSQFFYVGSSPSRLKGCCNHNLPIPSDAIPFLIFLFSYRIHFLALAISFAGDRFVLVLMLPIDVILQIDFLGERLVALVAFDLLAGIVHTQMLRQIGRIGECLFACGASVVAFVGVRSNVHFECARLIVRFIAHGAFEWSLFGVDAQMRSIVARLHERFGTIFAFVETHVGMQPQMVDQIRFARKRLAAHLTHVHSFQCIRIGSVGALRFLGRRKQFFLF